MSESSRPDPLSATRHATGLFEAGSDPGAEARFEYLPSRPPRDLAEVVRTTEAAAAFEDPLAFAVVEPASGEALGRQSLLRIVPEHGVIEIGDILWRPRLARSRRSTEAFFLAAAYVFDTLGYRHFEWKCNARNAPSRAAAEPFGFRFEGSFHQQMWLKGRNRDTAWFGMTDRDWAVLRPAYQRWLDPANFVDAGTQRLALRECIAAASDRRGRPNPILAG